MMDIQLLKELTKNISLLYVEDKDDSRSSVQRYLNKMFNHIHTANNGEKALNLYRKNKYDIVLTDINTPYLNSLDMTRKIKSINPNQEIIITSSYNNTEYFLNAIKMGINGHIIKPIEYTQMNQVLYKSIVNINNLKENLEYKIELEKMLKKRTSKTVSLEKEKIENFEMTLTSFASMIEERDNYTGGHSERVAKYCRLIAQEMNCTEDECNLIYRAGILHDIGKVTTPDSILLKPKKLSELEFKIIQEHVTKSHEILLKIPMYKDMADIIICHHERHDGKGYPNALSGNDIPFLSRIMIVADAFDAMTTNRIYKTRKDIPSAIDELKTLSGKQFHPEVVKSAMLALREVKIEDNINQMPSTEIEKERFSYFFRDNLTKAYNTEYLNFTLTSNVFDKKYTCINALYLHSFNKYNQKNGWADGDELLRKIVDCLYEDFKEALIFRVHGDDFIILNKKHLEIDINRLECLKVVKAHNIGISKRHIDLREEEANNFRELEILLLKEIQSE